MKTILNKRVTRWSTVILMFVFACLGLAPAARAGLTFELHVVRFQEGQMYKFFTPLYTNSTGSAAALGTYFISSPLYSASQNTNGSWRELQVTADGVNTLGGTENSYPDYASLMNQITNGPWTMVFTNNTTTNTYTFSVSAATVTSNMLPATVITYPVNNTLEVANQPTFTWLGPTNWPIDNTILVYNWDFSFYQYASVPASQESATTPFTIPNGINCTLALENATNNTTPVFTISTPMNGGIPLSGWIPTDVLESDDSVSFASTNPPVTSPVLVAHFSFDNSGNLGADSSGNNNNLDFNGGNGVTATNDAVAGGGAAYFDGSSFLTYSTPCTNVLNTLAGDFTLSFWIKTTQDDTGENYPAYFGDGIMAADIPGGYEDVIPAALDGGEIGINTGSFYGDDTVNSATDINDGNYHHVVITRSEETGEKDIYIDGALNNSDIASLNPLSDIRAVAVGCAIDASQTDPNNMDARQFFNGELDDLQLYAGILNSNQVASLFDNPGSTLNGVNGTLVAEYNFEDTNSPGLDSSGNGNDSNCGSGDGNPNPHYDVSSTNAAVGQYARQFFGDTSYCFSPPSQVFNNLSNALAGSFTVTAWVNTTNLVNDQYANALFGAPILFTYNDVSSVVPLTLTGNRAAITVTDPNGNYTTLHSATSVTDGKYHFIAVSRNVNTGALKIYVDGNLDASTIGPTNPVVDNSIIYLAGGFYQYVGLVDDVRIYSGELSAQSVASLASNGNPFGLALNATNLQWDSSGDTAWFVETTNTEDGVSAAQSGSVTNEQSSTLSTTVTGPGTLTFYWSSIADPDGEFDLEFSTNGVDVDDIYGDTSWYQDGPFNIPAGTYTLAWTAFASGDTDPTEAGFLDKVSFLPDTAPVITLNPFDQTNYPGYPVWLNAAATSNPTANWQWYKVGAGAVPGATSSYLIPTNSGTAGVAGQYYAIANNSAGSAITETATVDFVSAPLPPDWSVAFKSPFNSQNLEAFTKDYYYGCVVDTSSNIYAAAEFGGNMTVGSQNLDSGSGGDAAAVVKQTPTGSALWAAAITNNGAGNSYAECVALATNGGVYVAGNYSGNQWLGTNALVDAGGGDIFLACFNAGGTNLWLKTFGGTNTDFMLINSLVSDPSGNVTLAGLFGSGALQIGSSNYNVVGQQSIIIQLSPTGAVRWSQLVPSSFIQYLTYSAGRIYFAGGTSVTGGTTNFVIGSISNVTDRAWGVACLDANTGNALWVRGVGAQYGAGAGDPYSSGVSDDVPRLAASGTNLFMTGVAYGPSASFGPYTVNFALPRGQYFARYDTNGNPQTATSYGSVTTTPLAAVANAAGDVYVSGYFDTYSFFGNDMIAGPANPRINQGGFSQSFLAKFDPNGNPLWAREAIAPFQITFLGVALAPDGVWASGWGIGTNTTQVQSIEFGTNYVYSDPLFLVGGEGGGVLILWNPGGMLAKVNDAVSVAVPVKLLTLQDIGANFQFSFTSQANFNHVVQYTTNLLNPNWQTYTNVAGDGTVKTIPIPLSVFNPSRQGFVRVSTQ